MKFIRPRICFIGQMMPPTNSIRGQIFSLWNLFQMESYTCYGASESDRRIDRLIQTTSTLWKHRKETDLIVMDLFGGLSFYLEDIITLTASRLNIPIIAVLRGGGLPEFLGKNKQWGRRVFQRLNCCITPSSYLQPLVEDFSKTNHIIPNVIEIEKYPYRCRHTVAPRFLWMRSFHEIYNPLLAVKAFSKIKSNFPNAKMTMAGPDKGLLQATKSLAQEMGLFENIEFPGFINFQRKIEALKDHDVYLNTNIVDNMPVSVIEACASGLPIVATAVGGIPSLLRNEETALLVEDNNADQFAAAMSRVVSDPGLGTKLSERGRQLAEQSSWSNVHKQWVKVFAEVNL